MIAKTKVHRINEFDEQEWTEDYCLTQEQYLGLQAAQDNGEDVTVDCEACDGYYDLTLRDGTTLQAISGYHLVDLANILSTSTASGDT